jgi:hypothetical protein
VNEKLVSDQNIRGGSGRPARARSAQASQKLTALAGRRRFGASRRLPALLALGLLVIGCSSAAPAAQPSVTPKTASQPPTDTPAATPTTSRPTPAVSPFASLAAYLRQRAGHVTAALYDARTQTTWLLHPGMRQYTASIVKVQILGTALREAELSGRPLSGSERATLTTMIENSDNNAATSMLAQVGGPSQVGRFDRSIGMTQTTPSTLAFIPGTDLPGWGLTTTSALDQVKLVSKFAYPNAVFTPAHREYGLSLMEHIEADQAWGVTGGVPRAGTLVALKNGWVPIPPQNLWQVDSIGWISGHGRDYILAVLTSDNPSEGYGIDTISAISSRVFTELGNR